MNDVSTVSGDGIKLVFADYGSNGPTMSSTLKV